MSELDSIKWWHRIDLGDCITPGQNVHSDDLWDSLDLPENMSGLSVLDIGCWDGYFSFKCEQRSASRVVASDRYVWDLPDVTEAGFEYARKKLNSKVEKYYSYVEDIDTNVIGKFDIVLFFGILYHTPDPLKYLEIVKSVCSGTAIIETSVDFLDIDVPVARYWGVNESLKDESRIAKEIHNKAYKYNRFDTIPNYWGPNPLAVIAMMEDVGFKNIRTKELKNKSRMIFFGEV